MLKPLGFALVLLAGTASAAAPNYKVVGEIKAADGGWDLLSVDPVSHRLYVARADGVTAVDLASGKVTEKLVAADRGHAALTIPGTSDIILTSGNDNMAVILNGVTGQVRAKISTGKRPDAATYDPATRTVWIMNPGDGSITVADPLSAKVIATLSVGGPPEPGHPHRLGQRCGNIEATQDAGSGQPKDRNTPRP